MKKILNISSWVIAIALTLVFWSFASGKEAKRNYNRLIININHHEENLFVNEKDIELFVLGTDSIKNKPADFFKINNLEKRIDALSEVKKSEVYRSLNGNLHIDIIPKIPIARIFNKSGASFYIDKDGNPMLLSKKYTARTPVFSGDIDIKYNQYINLDYNDTDSLPASVNLYKNIYNLAHFVATKPFWKAQIEQVYVNKDLTYTLIPRVGNHTIVLGKANNMELKFKRLKIFYNQGLSKIGWNKYKTIDLSYKHQIICTKY